MIATLNQIAKAWGISVHQINKLAKNGTIPKAARGKYEIIGATRAYVEYMRKGRDEERRDEIRKEELAILRLDKQRKELDLVERRAGIIAVEDVGQIFSQVAASIRSMLLGAPRRISHELGKSEIEEMLEPHFRKALDELAALPNDAAGVYQALRRDVAEGVPGLPASAEDDRKPVGRPVPRAGNRARRKRSVAHVKGRVPARNHGRGARSRR